MKENKPQLDSTDWLLLIFSAFCGLMALMSYFEDVVTHVTSSVQVTYQIKITQPPKEEK